ncbi:MAG: cupin domain-containing protein [Variovorax paradoxus]|uniref:Cupin domain-containing protein n=1 Tax=Variovorax paradoxus TaxID=34073 RepID=A0A2W5SJ66_VARPD|nr:MAG: cupin domain-containing protein [Variovorax paradoxus]
MPHSTVRRFVTGHNALGRSIIVESAQPTVYTLPGVNVVFHELWSTDAMPISVPLHGHEDPAAGPVVLPPPANGTRFRIIDIPPDKDTFRPGDEVRMKEVFSKIGDADASTASASARHPAMHRTESVDYAFVIEGEITLLLDEGEAHLKSGDVVIQRGTNHAWSNRSDQKCRMLFVLMDGKFQPELRAALGSAAH